MQELRVVLTKIGEMEGAIIALKEQLRTVPHRMARELSTDQQKLDAARYLYWQMPDLPTASIAEGLLGMQIDGIKIDTFLKRIRTTTLDVPCDRCGEPMECRSREQMKKVLKDAERGHQRYAEGYCVLCEPCWTAVQQERMQP